ncbi:helix-turn-helix domain-containing protein [Salegentibacter sediminis]|uniref:helix-turn-helix domain-containing protein n=1 Tax=Salegentibacter sediminis TaxID=1930251 RepID=UPI0012FFC8EA|nr:helix-turn-helix domain-containing protein [Salegentibacter sediminis]
MRELLQEIKSILQSTKLNTKETLSAKEAAQYMGISLSTLYQLTSQSKITHYKPSGKLIFFKRKDLDDFLQQNKSEGIKIDNY